MRVEEAPFSIPVHVILGDLPPQDVERALRAGGLRVKRLDPDNRAQVEALYTLLLRELDRNSALRAGLLRAWERADRGRAARLRAAVQELAAASALDPLAWFRRLAAAEGWQEAMQACFLLADAYPVLKERVWTAAVSQAYYEWQARAEALAGAQGVASDAAATEVAAAACMEAPAAVAHEAATAPAPGSGSLLEDRTPLREKAARLDQLLRTAQQEVRRLKEERADLQRRLTASLARTDSYRQEAQKLRVERDLLAAQLQAVAGWPAPRARVERLLQALWQAVAERAEAEDRARTLAADLADLQSRLADGPMTTPSAG